MRNDAKSALVHVSLASRFLRSLAARLPQLRREVLAEVLRAADKPTVGDLLELIQEDLYLLEPGDPTTVGDLLGHPGGPTLVELLEGAGLPLVDPLAGDPTPSFLEQPLVDVAGQGRAVG